MEEIKHLPKASALKHHGLQPPEPWPGRPAGYGVPEQTQASIDAAKAACAAERARVKETTGLEIGADGSLRLSKADREALETRRAIEAIETLFQLVRQYGVARVSIWFEAAAQRAGERS